MSVQHQATEPGLSQRIDDLQVRVEHLESLLLGETDVSGVTDVASDIEVDTVAAASAGPRDLRRLQAEATADFTPTWVSAEPKPSEPMIDLRAIEERFAGRALAVVGGAALLLGAIFFLSLAFSRGWIGPGLQVMLGLAGGSTGLLIGAVLLRRGDRLVGHVLTAVGLAVISLSFFAATSLYGLIDPTVALAGVFVTSAVTTVIAIATRSQIVAGFGLVAALAAPPVLGAEPEPATVVYMVAALAGIATISLWQTWSWLPPIAFVLSAPQLYQWIATGPEPWLGVAALLLYWGLLTLAAGGEAFRRRGHELSVTSAPLFLAVGASVIGLGFVLIEPDVQRAAFLLVLALFHGIVTAFFVRRRGAVDPFGLLVGAYGIAIASAAVPLVAGATLTAVVWAAEAATLAFFASRTSHGPSLIAATALFTIAAGRLAYESLRLGPMGDVAGLGTTGGSADQVLVGFTFFVAIGVGIIALVPVRSFRLLIVGMMGLVALPITDLALDGVASIAGWITVALVTVGSPRWLAWLPERPISWRLGPALRWLRPTSDPWATTEWLPMAAGACAMVLATMGTVSAFLEQDRLPQIPFTDAAGLSALILAVGFAAVGILRERPASLRRGLLAAGLTVGVASISELPVPWCAIVWGALAVAAAWMARLDDRGTLTYAHAALGALGVLALFALFEAPPDRLVVQRFGIEPHPFMVSEATLVLGSLIMALAAVVAARTIRPARLADALVASAGVVALYLLSVGVVDVFAIEAYGVGYGDVARVDELTKEAQVALSVLWTFVGVVVLGIGLVMGRANLRLAGLVVLGLATAKVFLVDLASLDVAYRVITLIVLGLLLVASAYAWTRLRPTITADPTLAGHEVHADVVEEDVAAGARRGRAGEHDLQRTRARRHRARGLDARKQAAARHHRGSG